MNGCLSFLIALAILSVVKEVAGFEYAVLVGIAWLLSSLDVLPKLETKSEVNQHDPR